MREKFLDQGQVGLSPSGTYLAQGRPSKASGQGGGGEGNALEAPPRNVILEISQGRWHGEGVGGKDEALVQT